jgi:hypothetical protein
LTGDERGAPGPDSVPNNRNSLYSLSVFVSDRILAGNARLVAQPEMRQIIRSVTM